MKPFPGFLRRRHSCPLGFDSSQQRFGAVVAADQFGVVFTPLLGQFASKCLSQNGLGQTVDPCQGVVHLFLDGVGVGEELVYAADDFGLRTFGWGMNMKFL